MKPFYRMLLLSLTLLVLLLSVPEKLFAQENVNINDDDNGEALRIDSAAVFCDLSVRDKRGATIANLTADNFIIYEDGRVQNIEHFINSPAPIDLVMVFDISGSTQSKLTVMRQTAKNFINRLTPADQVAIVQFDESPEVLTGLTNHPILIEHAIAQLGTRPGYGSSVYDAMIYVSELFKDNRSKNHKAVLMITDGVDNSSSSDLARVKKVLESQSASYYFIDLDTEAEITSNYFGIAGAPFTRKQLEKYYRSLSLSDREIKELMAVNYDFPRDFIFSVTSFLYKVADREMQEIAEYMGGRVYKVSRIEDLAQQYQIILDDLRSLYTIGYYPTIDSPPGTFHKITIRSKQANLVLSYRRGYRNND